MRFDTDGVEHTLKVLGDEDMQKTNNQLKLIDIGLEKEQVSTFKVQGGENPMLSTYMARIATLGNQRGWNSTWDRRSPRVATLGVQEGWDSMLDKRSLGIVTLGAQGG